MQAWSTDAELLLQRRLADLKVNSLKELPAHTRKELKHEANEMALVHIYGANYKKDKDGKPLQSGIGSPDNITRACVEAYITEQTKRRDVPEAGYEQHLAWLKERLEACEARRRAEQLKEEQDDDE
jgi:hypothetical protein